MLDKLMNVMHMIVMGANFALVPVCLIQGHVWQAGVSLVLAGILLTQRLTMPHLRKGL